MGLSYYFHLQHFDGQVWKAMPEFEDPDDRVKHGEFAWFDRDCVSIHRLFLSKEAMFPLHRDVPPDFVITELYRMSNRSPNMSDEDVLECMHSSFEEKYVGWIGFDDLNLHCWRETKVLVEKHVRANVAWAFGNGDQPFPRTALLQAGWSEEEIIGFADLKWYGKDKQFDPKGYGLVDTPVRRWEVPSQNETAMCLVSWSETLAEFVGMARADKLFHASSLVDDNRLRLLCLAE